jgi:hypothetical protein
MQSNMKKEQYEVLKWWHGSRNYQQGILLLSRFSRNKALVHTLMKPGKEKFGNSVSKLHYELTKSQGLDWRNMPRLPEGSIQDVDFVQADDDASLEKNNTTSENLDEDLPAGQADESLDLYPKVIRRLKYEYSNLYKERSLLHRQMREIPEPNTLKNTFARAEKLKAIKLLSAKMDHLYKFIEDFEKSGIVPLEETVWPVSPANALSVQPELPRNISELKRMKKNLQSDNTKDRNRLLFQQRTQGAKEQPMPVGPKRTKIELRIKKKEEEIISIDNLIIQLENAD